MPVYFFHLIEGDDCCPDEEGTRLANAEAARRFAVLDLRSIIAADIERGILSTGQHIEVTDDRKRLLATVRFEDAVKVRRDPTLITKLE